MNELQRQSVAEANAAHARFLEHTSLAADQIIAMANAGREVGIRILTVRDNDRHWEQLTLGGIGHSDDGGEQSALSLSFTTQHAKVFLRMADRLPEPATTVADALCVMKDAMMIQGTLPFPDGHGHQQLHDHDPTGFMTLQIMKMQATWNKSIRDDARDWDQQRKYNLAKQIEPVVAMYNWLMGLS